MNVAPRSTEAHPPTAPDLATATGLVLAWLVLALLGLAVPTTGPEIARVILWNFSLPVWVYFTLADASSGLVAAPIRSG